MGRKTIKVLESDVEEYEKLVLEANKLLVEDYLIYMRSLGRSEKTIKVYKNNLYIFFIWCAKNLKNKDFAKFKKKDLIKFQQHMISNGLSSARIRNVKATLSSLSNYIENIIVDDIDIDEDDPEILKFKNFHNFIQKVENPKLETVRDKSVFKEEEIQKLLDELVDEEKYDKACILALAVSSGRRKAELLRIKPSFINDDFLVCGSLYKTPEKIQTKGKMLTVYIIKSKFKKYFDLWMDERHKRGIPDDVDILFPVRKNGTWVSMSESNLDRWAEDFTKRLSKPFYFHSMRHLFTTNLSESGLPDSLIQSIVGWSSLDMVSIYVDTAVDTKLEAYFDENGIKEVEKKNLSDL